MQSTTNPTRRIRPWMMILVVILVIIAIGMLLGFILGFISSILSTPGDYSKASRVGLKAGIMMTTAVFTIGIVGLSLKRLRVPPQLESAGSFAVGFAVMNGLRAWMDSQYDKVLTEAITGFFLGAIVGSAMFIFRRRGLVPTATSRSTAVNQKDNNTTR